MCAVQLLRVSVHERISAAAEDFLLQLQKAEEAAEVPALRALLTERLTAAAEEIVALLEETVAEYEERVERSEREVCRQRRLLDAVLKPEVRLHRADDQLSESKEDQDQDQDQDQQDPPGPPHIKEEQEEVWRSQEGGQLGGLEEAEVTKVTLTPVKSEDDEEEAQSSQLTVDCGGPGPHRDSDPDPCRPDSEDQASEFCVAEIEVSCDDYDESGDSAISCSDGGKRLMKVGCVEAPGGEKPYSCSDCGKKYSKKCFLVQHMSVHRGNTPRSCSVCNKRLVWQVGLECHRCVGGFSRVQLGSSSAAVKMSDGGGAAVSECDKKLCYSRQLRRRDADDQPTLFSCSVCGRRFTQRGYLLQHMRRHTGGVRYRCCVCNQRFAWRHQLKNHTCGGESSRLPESQSEALAGRQEPGSDSEKTSDSDADPQSENTAVTDGKKSLICSECGKAFCGEENLKTHMRTHSGEKPFSCSVCEKGFPQAEQLSKQPAAPSEDKRFLYCVCGKRFAWRYNLEKHRCSAESSRLQTEENPGAERPTSSCSTEQQTEVGDDGVETTSAQHQGEPSADERPFSCSQCSKRFRRKKNLQEHLRIHTGEKPYGCSVCMKYFSCSGSLRKHLRIHTGEKPFGCSVCGNRFTESGHLKVHMRTHTGEKPFSCSVCGKSFTWRQSFNNHMKYHTETRAASPSERRHTS